MLRRFDDGKRSKMNMISVREVHKQGIRKELDSDLIMLFGHISHKMSQHLMDVVYGMIQRLRGWVESCKLRGHRFSQR